jgi:hypothetical protein
LNRAVSQFGGSTSSNRWLGFLAGLLLLGCATHSLGQQTWEPGSVNTFVNFQTPVNAPGGPPPQPLAPLGAFGSPANPPGSVYVTPPSREDATFDPFGWGSRYDRDVLERCPPVVPQAVAEDTVKKKTSRLYFRAEALVLKRSPPSVRRPLVETGFGSGVLLTERNLTFTPQLGQRYTAGIAFNESSSMEFTYWDVQNFRRSITLTGDQNLILPGDFALPPATFDFFGASLMQIDYLSNIKNTELNFIQRLPYDKFYAMVGFRHLDIREQFNLASTQPIFDTGHYVLNTGNHLNGGQLGMIFRQDWDLFTVEGTGKAGMYVNNDHQSNKIIDFGNFVFRDASAKGSNQSFVGELNLNGVYRVSGNWQVRMGYNLIWVNRLVLAPDQIDFTDTAISGTNLYHRGNVLMHGASFGLEASW